MNINIEISEAQIKALAFIAVDPTEWVRTLVNSRAAAAIDEMYALEVKRMLDDPATTSVPADKEAVVLASLLPSAAYAQQILNEAAKTPAIQRTIPTAEFRAKFTDAQLAALWAKAASNPALSVFLMKTFTTQTVDLDSAEVKNGMKYLVALGFAMDLGVF